MEEIAKDVNDLELSDVQGEGQSEMPILRTLIKSIAVEKTLLTDQEIKQILKNEYNMDVEKCSALEQDIYIKVIKTFMRQWPEWRQLQNQLSMLNGKNDSDAVNNLLQQNYESLKEYLGVMLKASIPMTKKAVAEVEANPNQNPNPEDDIVMEVHCTREQLKNLVYRTPQANNTIFNTTKIEPRKPPQKKITFECILNYWWTKVYINLPYFMFSRELMYTYTHKLKNMVLKDDSPIDKLDTRTFNRCKKARECNKDKVFECFDKILTKAEKDKHLRKLLNILFQTLKKDMDDVPRLMKVPSYYKKYGNLYKYVRHLNVDTDEPSNSKFDLCIEETVAPTYRFFVGRSLIPSQEPLPPIEQWLKMECMLCKLKFSGARDLLNVVQTHFHEHHQEEADWQCLNCKALFSMDFLSKNRWKHVC